MGKLTKHAEVLTQLHSLVKKQAEEAQKNISGVPGVETKPTSVSAEHETTNKNSVGPEELAQTTGHQKPSTDPAAPVKSAETLGNEILNIIRKHADVQDSATGEPGKDTNPESVEDNNIDKNKVKPEDNKPQTTGEQKPSSDKSEPVAKAAAEECSCDKEDCEKCHPEKKDEEKKAEDEVSTLASKVASYELGRQFCAALLKTASETVADEATLMKEAGRRDLDLLIAQAAQELDSEVPAEKQAEEAGAAYFEEVLKQAALDEAVQENEALKAKIAELSQTVEQTLSKEAQEKKAAEEAATQVKLAEAVAAIVLERIKSEAGKE
jgi:hypothetical protein